MRLLIQNREVRSLRQAPTRERITSTAAMAKMWAAFLCPQELFSPDAEERLPDSVSDQGEFEGSAAAKEIDPDLVLWPFQLHYELMEIWPLGWFQNRTPWFFLLYIMHDSNKYWQILYKQTWQEDSDGFWWRPRSLKKPCLYATKRVNKASLDLWGHSSPGSIFQIPSCPLVKWKTENWIDTH